MSLAVSPILSTVATVAYVVVLVLLAVYGFHRSQLVYLYFKHRRRVAVPPARFAADALPVVTVQLPLFNELYVVERLLEAVARVDWPADRLEIQVLDDSTDETADLARAKVAELCARGLDVKYLHRAVRTGFKAGALEHGLGLARGELVLVFDADFVPAPDVLRKTVDHFTDAKVGMVQVRWEHVNRRHSVLTETQAMMLDAHFIIEHGARCRSGRFFNFNGTAGIWRKQAILDAGGWHHDTLTEDMDLSYRAQLAGWRFEYLPEIVAPAELPIEMNSFKSQQFRWAKGSIQVARKLLPAILRSDVPARVKLEAFFHLTNNFAYPLMLLLCLLLVPSLIFRADHGVREALEIDLPLFLGTTLSIATFYMASQRELHRVGQGGAESARGRGVLGALVRLPVLMAIGIGLCVNQARAVIEGLVGHDTEFVRTPKTGITDSPVPLLGAPALAAAGAPRKYLGVRTLLPLAELALAAYYAAAVFVAVRFDHYATLPFLVMFGAGFAYVGTLSLRRAPR